MKLDAWLANYGWSPLYISVYNIYVYVYYIYIYTLYIYIYVCVCACVVYPYVHIRRHEMFTYMYDPNHELGLVVRRSVLRVFQEAFQYSSRVEHWIFCSHIHIDKGVFSLLG